MVHRYPYRLLVWGLFALAIPWSAAMGAEERHWAFKPVPPSAVSETLVEGVGGYNPIDSFIRARLATNGLALAPAADRVTLIRRLTFDLTGLPPTPAEIDGFTGSASSLAYEELVERLLASPRYGERWARHWLDVARYTESQGFEYDKLRDNAWHYRDYVIKSFNDDKPYDRFMKEQIAGDALEPATSEAIIGASLLVCGPWDEAGNSQANPTQKAITREEELEDLIGVVGQTFLALTVNCARCHAHKFDPISQEEYYRVKSVFEGVKHGERPIGAAVAADAKTPRRVSYAGTRVQPSPTRLLARGDVKSPGDVVTPAGLAAIATVEAEFGLGPDAPEAERRLKFAEWVADSRHPLPARVMANRVWHWHFGRGLVLTPNDFGASGAPPTHPELLDWLAAKFIESGWSVKALHRLIVTSATYRQCSVESGIDPSANPETSAPALANAFRRAAAIDVDNALLWRFTPRRLEAEAVRDAMLAVSGQLNLEMGGASFRPFDALKFPANAYVPVDKIGPEFNRRTVYRMNVNSGKEPLLDVFDCPDPSVKTPRRGVTVTPLQALALMNNSFVQRQATCLADRAMRESNQDPNEAVHAVYRLALGRSPTNHETKRALATAEERGLASVCWALFNSTEFIYVR